MIALMSGLSCECSGCGWTVIAARSPPTALVAWRTLTGCLRTARCGKMAVSGSSPSTRPCISGATPIRQMRFESDKSWTDFAANVRANPAEMKNLQPTTSTTTDPKLYHLWQLLCRDLVPDPLGGNLALELGKGQQHVEGQPSH
jgi:hypothetical protein